MTCKFSGFTGLLSDTGVLSRFTAHVHDIVDEVCEAVPVKMRVPEMYKPATAKCSFIGKNGDHIYTVSIVIVDKWDRALFAFKIYYIELDNMWSDTLSTVSSLGTQYIRNVGEILSNYDTYDEN